MFNKQLDQISVSDIKPELLSVFRTDAWISAWNEIWEADLIARQYKSNQNGYLFHLPLLKLFSLRTATPLGCGSRVLASIRSEYFQFPVDVNLNDWFKSELGLGCHQFVIPDVDIESDTFKKLSEYANKSSFYLHARSGSLAYGVVTKRSSFADYLSVLGQNSRARLFNRRKRLQELGKINLRNMWPDVEGFIDLLNQFHRDRWGKPCFQENNLAFIKLFLQKLSEQGGQINLSLMTLDEKPISVLLDVLYARRVYNFQAGYIENVAKNVALGSLHLGYEIEAAFANPQIDYYDFMAGQGKNTDYKAAFATNTQKLADIYLTRHAWLHWLYQLNDRVKKS